MGDIDQTPPHDPDNQVSPAPDTSIVSRPARLLRDRYWGRTDLYLLETPHGRSKATCAREPVTDALLEAHVTGKKRVGIYQTDPPSYGMLDFDAKNSGDVDGAWKKVRDIHAVLNDNLGIRPAVEVSRSGKGWHVWIYTDPDDPPSLTEIRDLLKGVLRDAGLPDDGIERKDEDHPGIFPHPPGTGDVGRTSYLPWSGLLAGATGGLFVDIETMEPIDRQETAIEDADLVTRDRVLEALKHLPEPATVAKPSPAKRDRRTSPEVAAVLERLNVDEFYAAHVEDFRPNGSTEEKCRCPFCPPGKSKSLAINRQDGTWYCHREKIGGDVFTLVERLHGVGFPEALRQLQEFVNLGPALENELVLLEPSSTTKVPRAATRDSGGAPFNFSDAGNADRLVQHLDGGARYVATWARWYLWTGTHWAQDETLQIVREARATLAKLAHKVFDFAQKSEKVSRLKAMIDIARADSTVAITHCELDRDPWSLNVRNGTLDLRTGKLRDHRRADLITRCIPVAYDPAAPAPVFEGFMEKIFDGNVELIEYVTAAVGYSLTGSTSGQCFFLCHGTGANGKSTLLEAVRNMLGGYAKHAPF